MPYLVCFRDGCPDIAQNSAHPHTADVYVSSGGNNHWLKVRLEGIASNRDAIGAKVTLYSGGEAQLRHRFCGESYLSQSSASLFFGLNEASQADSIQITWPSGLEEKHYNVPADQSVVFEEGASLAVDIIAEAEVACPNTPITFASSLHGNTYFWNGEEGDSTLTVTEPGVYTLEVIHPLGFELTSEAQEFTWFPETEAEVNAIDPSCFGGSDGSIEVSSAQGINQVVWNGIESSSAFVEGLSAGTYSAAIYDGNNCTSFENVTLEEGIVLDGTLTITDAVLDESFGLATVSMINGEAPYTYDWSTGCSNLACPKLEGGEYSITVTDSNGCSWSSEFDVEVLVNIAEAKKEEILAFPNPFNDQIHVQIQHDSMLTLEVLNSLGQVVFNGQMTANSMKLDTSAWPSGTYALIVRNGDQVYKRILIKH